MLYPKTLPSVKLVPACLSLLVLMGSSSTISAAKTEKPDIGCHTLGNDLSYKCTTAGFTGLQGHPASGLLYDIIRQSTLPDDTFYKNDRHVACLFRDTKFVLDVTGVGAGAGAKAGPATFQVGVEGAVNNELDGTLCAFPSKVSSNGGNGDDKDGGLTLAQVRALAEELVNTPDCNLCGQITANYHTQNASALGRLKFDWRDNAICQHPCIRETDLSQANATDAKPAAAGDDGKKSSGRGTFVPSTMVWAEGLGSLVVALLCQPPHLIIINHVRTVPRPPRAPAASWPRTCPSPAVSADDAGAEPGVEVKADTLEAQPILGGSLVRYIVGTNAQVPTSNDGHGTLPIADVPGMGIVLPNGTHMYYLDVAPNTEGVMHRTTSADYLVVLQGTLSLMTPGDAPYVVRDGKRSYGEPVRTECRPGEVVFQRGMMHALSNHTSSWVRLLVIVLDAKPNRVPIVETHDQGNQTASYKVLEDQWLA
ncbi:hypothetical protein PG997_015394 [Apiospora hydei]|uniref:Cupin type-1 domain-containing protein n=1 Tax=Apiospora hydei TaxID=1337664 RepID=A0ABR1UTM7_9PEZI